MVTLAIKSRDTKDAPERLRKSGLVPAVFYGPKQASTPIVISARKLEQVWEEAGHTSVVTLSGVGDSKDTLIHDVQVHPVSGSVLHVDFYVLEKGKKVTIAVPLEFIGHAPAEKLGHVIVKALHEIEIEVAPAELPHTLGVDLARLENVGDRILASDIALPASATLITQGEEIVASVTGFKEEKEEVSTPTPAEGAAPTTEATPAEPAASE